MKNFIKKLWYTLLHIFIFTPMLLFMGIHMIWKDGVEQDEWWPFWAFNKEFWQ